MINKKIVFFFICIFLCFSLVFPCFADYSIDSFEDFYVDGDGSCYVLLDDNSEVESTVDFLDSNSLTVNDAFGQGANAFELSFFVNGFDVSQGETLTFSSSGFVLGPIWDYNDIPSEENCFVNVTIISYDLNGNTLLEETAFNARPIDFVQDYEGGYYIYDVVFPFNFSYDVSVNASSFEVIITFGFPPADSLDFSPSEDEIIPLTVTAESFSVRSESSPEPSFVSGIIGGISSFVDGATSWILSFVELASKNYIILLIGFFVPLCGIGIGLLKRLLYSNS